jgi:hypothetical protein
MGFAAQRRCADYRARPVWAAFFTTAADPLCWTPGESSREMVRSIHNLSTPMCILRPRTRAYSVAP